MRKPESFLDQPVRSLQTMLRVIAADRGRKLSVTPDGFYGRQTLEEVSRFQRDAGLPVTGVTDQTTWERVVEAYGPALTRMGPAQSIEVVWNPAVVQVAGGSHPNILLAQSMLLVMNRAYGSIPPVTVTGVLDLPTAEALTVFQTMSGLPGTGELDRLTWKHLSLHYPMAANLSLSRGGRRI